MKHASRQLRFFLAFGGFLLAIVGVVAVAAAALDDGTASGPPSLEKIEQQRLQEAAAVASGEAKVPNEDLDVDPGDDRTSEFVIGPDGKPIQCGGSELRVQNKGAQSPIAYIKGHEDQAVAMADVPEGPREIASPDGVATGYAPRCGDGNAPIWIPMG